MAPLIEILKYFGIEDKVDITNLTQEEIIILIRAYYESLSN